VPECLALLVPSPLTALVAADQPAPDGSSPSLLAQARFVRERFGRRAWLAAELLLRGHDTALLERLREAESHTGLPLVAAGDVHFHVRSRKALHDVLGAIRLGRPVAALGLDGAPNAEQHLRSRLRLARIYPAALLEQTLEIRLRVVWDSSPWAATAAPADCTAAAASAAARPTSARAVSSSIVR
jgi:error-prone DNA polymerase